MPRHTFALVLIPVLLAVAPSGAVAGEPVVGVALSTPRECYLVGEPVPLVVAVKNISQSDLVVSTEYVKPNPA